MDTLTAILFLFNLSTLADHYKSRKMKSQELGAAVLSSQAQSNVYVMELYQKVGRGGIDEGRFGSGVEYS
ncbi:hypothetical protein Hanom_Chr10g00939861 [Helianthus anomalus]